MDLKEFLKELDYLKNISEELLSYIEKKGKIKSEKIEFFLLELEKIVPQIIFFMQQIEMEDIDWLNIILEDLELGIINEDAVLFMDTLYNGLVSLLDKYIEMITGAIYE